MTDDIRPILTLNHIEKPTEDRLLTQLPLLQHHDFGVPNLVRYANDFITQTRPMLIWTISLNIKEDPRHLPQ